MIEQKGYLKIGNMYLSSIVLNIFNVSNDFIKDLKFTADRRNALIISKDLYDELRNKLYISLDIDFEKTFFIEKEN